MSPLLNGFQESEVYESKNLVNWSHTTDILTTQVSLQGNPTNGSIWAPQISYADGLFYLVYTDVKSAGRPFKDVHNYLITASEITGPLVRTNLFK